MISSRSVRRPRSSSGRVAALNLPESYYRELARDYDRKRKILYDGP